MKLPNTWPFRPQDISTAPSTKETRMAEVNARKAGKPYKQKQRQQEKKVQGRKEKDGTEAVIKLDVLRRRIANLIDLKIKSDQAGAAYNDAVKATAEASGLLSATVNKFVRARAGDSFLEQKAKAQQLSLCFEELGPLDDGKSKAQAKHPSELFEGRDPDDEQEDGEDDDDEAGATSRAGDEQRPGVH